METVEILQEWRKPENITLSTREMERRKQVFGETDPDKIKGILAENSAPFQKSQRTSTKIRPRYRSYYNSKPGGLLQLDLMTLSTNSNKYQKVVLSDPDSPKTKFPYLLIAIDTFSRYIWAIPVESKAAKDVHPAIDQVITNLKDLYYSGDPLNIVRFKILTDAGKEFTGYKSPQVKPLISESKFGASLAEAAIKRVRNLIRLFSQEHSEGNTKIFPLTIAELTGLITNLNTSINSGVSDTASPQEILLENVKPKPLGSKLPLAPTKFIAGQYVRLINYQEREPNSYGTKSQVSSLFVKRSMFNNYTDKIFSILEIFVDTVDQLRIFKLVSIDGTYLLERKWYEFELSQPIPLNFVKSLTDAERDACEQFSDFELRFYNIRYTTEEDFADPESE